MNHDHIGAHLRNVLLDALLGTLSDGNHGNHGTDSDDDAQHRQKRAELVCTNGTYSYFKQIRNMHIYI